MHQESLFDSTTNDIEVSGESINDMDMECKFGMTDQFTKESGDSIRLMDGESFVLGTETNMKAIFTKTCFRALENI